MWDFLVKYADSFWERGEYAFEIFSVIMVWALSIGAALIPLCFISVFAEMIRDKIREYKKDRKDNGKE